MSDNKIDVTRLSVLLNELRLPAIKHAWETIAKRSDKEGWPAARLLATLAEHELAERDRRRLERHLGEAKLLPGKTLATLTSTPCRWSPRRRSRPCAPAMPGWKRAPT